MNIHVKKEYLILKCEIVPKMFHVSICKCEIVPKSCHVCIYVNVYNSVIIFHNDIFICKHIKGENSRYL